MLKDIYRFLSPRYQNLALDYKVAFKPRYGHGQPPHAVLYPIINANRAAYQGLLQSFLAYQQVFVNIRDAKAETDPSQPSWNNGFLPGLDIIGIYGMLAKFRPQQYVEVGSGNSTKVAYKVIQDQNLTTQITSIDPYPRAEIDQLASRIIREPFENIDFSFLKALGENDILFIDNSHRVLPNSDAMVFFMEVLPMLRKGVIVHIHDIYLPYDYPQFMCDRFYSEQYMLAAFLLANPQKYQTLLPNYFISEDPDLRQILTPLWQQPNLHGVEQHGGSLWLRIVE
ncbi:class I SAM-dependent methyltransferase [Hymenobacter weizhouensis]|uniref:class I SAM-dependent methyltransferase n=1 Tax=Hymenobacter sp. YIM 151500-1 TaxID=2987689 RepID=UPI0022268788|nr:class I SAM-dependent methyltransferase [Hymenobacter sp. YIM 151500-1]UYZ62541.1 class I SAM-dependent methyltransferase [Hymenobacter sp. YIM 151500-1]